MCAYKPNLILVFKLTHHGRNHIEEFTDTKYLYISKGKTHITFHLCTRFKLKFRLRFRNVFTLFMLYICLDVNQSTGYKQQYAAYYT